MAKRVFKDESIKTIVHNIAEDFRFSGEADGYALLFYRADTEGMVKGKDIDEMLEYVTTGLIELKNNISWRQEFLSENAGFDEMKMLNNLKTIEEEYITLKTFLEK
ncbi:MAG: hypothetical protein U9N52_07425 [Campylobacterota bacterium]|nr:hypothetical protein [Campylobacterota bacterium]